jgi:transcriptional regulator with XRE-family HTH domain
MRYCSQLRAARALLKLQQVDIFKRSGVSVPTLRRLEGGDGLLTGTFENIDRLRRAYEGAGVIFVDGDDIAGPGVRLRDDAVQNDVP